MNTSDNNINKSNSIEMEINRMNEIGCFLDNIVNKNFFDLNK